MSLVKRVLLHSHEGGVNAITLQKNINLLAQVYTKTVDKYSKVFCISHHCKNE